MLVTTIKTTSQSLTAAPRGPGGPIGPTCPLAPCVSRWQCHDVTNGTPYISSRVSWRSSHSKFTVLSFGPRRSSFTSGSNITFRTLKLQVNIYIFNTMCLPYHQGCLVHHLFLDDLVVPDDNTTVMTIRYIMSTLMPGAPISPGVPAIPMIPWKQYICFQPFPGQQHIPGILDHRLHPSDLYVLEVPM